MSWPSTQSETPDTPRPVQVRVKLNSVQDVQRELSKLYRLARAKKLDVSEASKLANILMLVARIMETGDLEARIEALERGDIQ